MEFERDREHRKYVDMHLYEAEKQIVGLFDHLRFSPVAEPYPVTPYVFMKYMRIGLLNPKEGFIFHLDTGNGKKLVDIPDTSMLIPTGFTFYKVYEDGRPPLVISYKFARDSAKHENFFYDEELDAVKSQSSMAVPCLYEDVVHEHTIGLNFVHEKDIMALEKIQTPKGILIDLY